MAEMELERLDLNGNPLQYSCLENPRDRGAWWAAVYGVTQSDTTEVTTHQQQRQPYNSRHQKRHRCKEDLDSVGEGEGRMI